MLMQVDCAEGQRIWTKQQEIGFRHSLCRQGRSSVRETRDLQLRRPTLTCLRLIGRDGQIRTADPSHPKRVLYQAEPRPEPMQEGFLL